MTTLERARILLTLCAATANSACSACSDSRADDPRREAGPPDTGPGGGGGLSDGSTPGVDATDGVSAADSDAPVELDSGGEYAWLTGQSGWKPTRVFAADCEPEQLDRSAFSWPGWSWEACGPGCQAADAIPGGAPTFAFEFGSGAKETASDFYLGLTANVLLEPPVTAVLAIRMGDGKVVGGLRSPAAASCLIRLGSPAACFLFEVGMRSATIERHYGLLNPDLGSIAWQQPSATEDFFAFDFVTGWGGLFGHVSLRVSTIAGSSKFSEVYSSQAWLSRPAVANEQVFFGETRPDGGAIARYMPVGATSTIAQGAWSAPYLAASHSRVVWLDVTGPRVFEGEFETARLLWAQNQKGPGGVVFDGAQLPLRHAPQGFATSESWAAVAEWDNAPKCNLLLANLDSHQVWRVPLGDLAWVLGVTKTEVFVGIRTDHADDGSFQRIRRYDLTRVKEYGTSI